MSSHKDQLRHALHITFYVSLYSSACLMVFLLGPMIGLTLPYEIVLVALILLTWPFSIAINHYRQKREQKKVGTDAQATKSATRKANRPGLNAPVRVYDELTRSAEEAVQWLRSTKLAVKSNDAIYKLPWFLIAGPSKSGKTSMLVSAGLEFQALPSQRQTDLNLIQSTRDAVWRVTNSAINIDTAGRYQTENQDREEWSALIETIKKYRK